MSGESEDDDVDGGRDYGFVLGKANAKREREEEEDARDVKFCKKCDGDTLRYANGGCVECAKARAAKRRAELKNKKDMVCITCCSAPCDDISTLQCRLCKNVYKLLLKDEQMKISGRFISNKYGDKKHLVRHLSMLQRNANVCALTGVALNESMPMLSRSLDRINSNFAHTMNNCQAVAQFANFMKSDASNTNFNDMIKAMARDGAPAQLRTTTTTLRSIFEAMGGAAANLPTVAYRGVTKNVCNRSGHAISRDQDALKEAHPQASNDEINIMLVQAYGVPIAVHRQRLAYLSHAHVAGVCARTRVQLVEGHKLYAPSIDAIDASKLHTLENTQIVCWAYNRGKSNYPAADFDNMLASVIERFAPPAH
jgi:hypothetical protein